jgi:tRNA-binding protein
MDFTAFDLRIATVVEAERRDDLLALTLDVGGVRRTSEARITENYDAESIVGRQVVAVTNGPGGEVIVLAAVSPSHGAVLVVPDRPVVSGTQVV